MIIIVSYCYQLVQSMVFSCFSHCFSIVADVGGVLHVCGGGFGGVWTPRSVG